MTDRTHASRTVAVGMSGGVDSTVAACLLLRKGYRVIGVTMQTWDGSLPLREAGASGCFGPGEQHELECARRQAGRLGIPHFVLPLADAYRKEVLDYVRSEYLAGRTPNPCVRCNRKVKFDALPTLALQRGIRFDYFATGHYARIVFCKTRGRFLLRKAADRNKDQSYFLSHLTQDQLQRCLFPLGSLTKTEVKTLAREMGWHDLSEKKESQDFLEGDDLECLFPTGASRPGDIVDTDGNILGQHRGIFRYTVGQRKRLGLSGCRQPLYVVRIDGDSHTLVVGTRQHLLSRRLDATDVNWISFARAPSVPLRIKARIRRQHAEADAVVYPPPRGVPDAVRVVFDEPQTAVTPGQTVVFYDGDTVVGGGTIAQNNAERPPAR